MRGKSVTVLPRLQEASGVGNATLNLQNTPECNVLRPRILSTEMAPPLLSQSGQGPAALSFIPRALSPVRFQTAEHVAGLRTNSGSDDSGRDDDPKPVEGNHFDKLRPPPPATILDEEEDDFVLTTPRDEVFTYLTNMTTSMILSICRDRGILQRGSRCLHVERILESVDEEKHKSDKGGRIS